MEVLSVGGYRVVRKLGEAARAEVYLGYPERDDSAAVPAAIKLYRPGVSQESVIGEIEALSRATGRHTVQLVDLATGPNGQPAVLMQRLSGGSLPRLLQERASVRLGEAVTILAPLVATVARLHASGVVHGGLRGEVVLFDAAGAPVLACFGRSRLIEPGLSTAALANTDAVVADRDAAAAMCRTVLSRVPDDAATDLAAWLAEHATDDWLPAFADRLFAAAEAEPVALGAVEAPRVKPQRVRSSEPVPESATSAALALPDWVARYVPQDLTARAAAALGKVRPRFWVAGGAVAVALVAAVMFVPSRSSEAADAVVAPAVVSPSASPPLDPTVGGDDAAAALVTLLEARDRCIRELSVLCLDAVAQPGSAALASDQEVIREMHDGRAAPALWNATGATVVEDLGGSALVAIELRDGASGDSKPASVLLVKGEAGWRIRDYLWL